MAVVGCVFAAVQEPPCEGGREYTPAMLLPVLLLVSHMAAFVGLMAAFYCNL